MKPVTPVNLVADDTYGTRANGSWFTLDITSLLGADAGNVAGVLLRAVNTNTGGTETVFGLRKQGSTDNIIDGILEDNSWAHYFVGLDSADQFQAYMGAFADNELYLEGYVTTDQGHFLTNMSELTLPANNSGWTTFDITAQVEAGDDPSVAILLFKTNFEEDFHHVGARHTSSTDDTPQVELWANDYYQMLAPLDASDQFQLRWQWIQAGGDALDTPPQAWVVGYLKAAAATMRTNVADKSTATTGSYVSTDVSAEVGAAADGAFFTTPLATTWGTTISPTSAEYNVGIRKDNTRADIYRDVYPRVQFMWSELATPAQTCEQKIENADVDLHLAGYTVSAAGGPDAPTLAATATSWDAVKLDITVPANATSVRVYRSTTSPVTASDTLVADVAATGTAFDTGLAAATQHFYLAVADDGSATTDGTEQSATTFADDAAETWTSGDPITFPLVIPSGEKCTSVEVDLGKVVRATTGLNRAVDFAITVDDEGAVEVGSDTVLDVSATNQGTETSIPLASEPAGPQTLTVTITPTIAA